MHFFCVTFALTHVQLILVEKSYLKKQNERNLCECHVLDVKTFYFTTERKQFDGKQPAITIFGSGCGDFMTFTLRHWFDLISSIRKNECVTGCTTRVEMVHCHPRSFSVTACLLCLPPSLSFQPPYPAGLLFIPTWPGSAVCALVCVCVCVCVGT